MICRYLFALSILLTLMGCTKFINTGEPIVDQLAYKIDPFSNCVVVLPAPSLDKYGGSYLAMSNAKFATKSPRQAVGELVANPPPLDKRPPSVFGNVHADECMLKITRPLVHGNVAIVEYGSPAGSIGAYALERRNQKWEVVERLDLGYW